MRKEWAKNHEKGCVDCIKYPSSEAGESDYAAYCGIQPFFLYNPLTRATEDLSDAMHREKSLKPKCIAKEERRYLNMFLAWYCNLQKGLQRECVATRTQTIKQLLSPAKSVLQEQCISRHPKHPSLPSLILLCWKKNIVCF